MKTDSCDKALAKVTEPIPPWHCHPQRQPQDWLLARQGLQQQWVDQVWDPFWHTLPLDARGEYLQRWGAPPAWKAALLTPTSTLSAAELAADLLESEAWLLNPRTGAGPSPSKVCGSGGEVS